MPYRAALILIGLLLTAGCLPSQQPPNKADLRANDSPTRIPALVGAAETDDEASLAELVYALSDKDSAVRLFAIRSLADRTGETMGYRYYASLQQRQDAIDRWHDWLKSRSIEPIDPAEPSLDTTSD
jgi:hypothetical protein